MLSAEAKATIEQVNAENKWGLSADENIYSELKE